MYVCCAEIVRAQHGTADGRINIGIDLPVYQPQYRPDHLEFARTFREQAAQYGELARSHRLGLTQDGHRAGTLELARDELGLLGANAFMSHAIDLTPADIEACVATGTASSQRARSCRSAAAVRCRADRRGRDRGAGVGPAPDTSYDMFRHMFQCMLPAGISATRGPAARQSAGDR
jgi:cytosine/adenosine deaminase-related metal-dependent hydrolase